MGSTAGKLEKTWSGLFSENGAAWGDMSLCFGHGIYGWRFWDLDFW